MADTRPGGLNGRGLRGAPRVRVRVQCGRPRLRNRERPEIALTLRATG